MEVLAESRLTFNQGHTIERIRMRTAVQSFVLTSGALQVVPKKLSLCPSLVSKPCRKSIVKLRPPRSCLYQCRDGIGQAEPKPVGGEGREMWYD